MWHTRIITAAGVALVGSFLLGPAEPALADSAGCWVTGVTATEADTGRALNTASIPGDVVTAGTRVKLRIDIDPSGPRGCTGRLEARVDPGGLVMEEPFAFMDTVDYSFTVPTGLTAGTDYGLIITTPRSSLHPDAEPVRVGSFAFRVGEAGGGGWQNLPRGTGPQVPGQYPAPGAGAQDAGAQGAAPTAEAPAQDTLPAAALPAADPALPEAPEAAGGDAPSGEIPAEWQSTAATTRAPVPDWILPAVAVTVGITTVGALAARIALLRRRRMRDLRLSQRE